MKPSENPLGSEPVSSLLRRFAIRSGSARAVSAPLDQGALAPQVGFEPTTDRLTADCSTD